MAGIKEFIKRWLRFDKKSSKDTLLFLFFVAMAAAFWILLSFNNNMTHDMIVKVKVSKPANVTFIQEIPATVTVTVKDRGLAFLKSFFHSDPSINIKFDKYNVEKNNSMEITPSQMLSEVRMVISREATILKVMPETINVKYTTLPGKKVPVNWEDNIRNITPDRQFVINPDMVTTDPDSVVVYAIDRATLNEISEVDLVTVEVANLSATYSKIVRFRPINGVRIIPDRVKLTVPVEPLIKKVDNVPISVRNQPYGINILLFPSSINVTYLLPQSKYKEPANLTVVVDYNDIDMSSNKVNVKLGEVSGAYSNVVLGSDSVNYVIERY
jgi:hypothetical protein